MTSVANRAARLFALPLIFVMTSSATCQTYSAPSERGRARAMQGDMAFHRSPSALLAEHRRLSAALEGLRPGRKGVVEAYVVVAALDGDPVFGREAAEAGRILSRRFDAAGRTIVMTADATGEGAVASPASLAIALARVGELADTDEDAVVLYTTSHGSAPEGIAYRDRRRGMGSISPDRMAQMLGETGLENRLVIVSACYSGIFVRRLESDTAAIVSAAAADRSSFGCEPGNDWTWFGDAFVNRALRKPQPLRAAFDEAQASIAGWERAGRVEASRPQISIGSRVARWLSPLEARMPAAPSAPVGRSPAGAGR